MTSGSRRGGGAEVLAAGGVVWRPTPTNVPAVVVVHRPLRADWSFPKGHLEPAEDDRTAAVREVWEETGMRCRVVDDLGEVRYRDRKDRPKRVRYFAMVPVSGGFEPNSEVDELRWLEPAAAAALLTYPSDRDLLVRFVERHLATA